MGQQGRSQQEEPLGSDFKDVKEKPHGGGWEGVPGEAAVFEELAGLSLLRNGQVGACHLELRSLKCHTPPSQHPLPFTNCATRGAPFTL